MKTVGLITEYNPFHKGHLYHLEKSKFLTKSEYSVSIMSGNFLQRGEPALIDKYKRAKMAVENGVDLVVELPFAFACQSAEHFAFGAVKVLDAMNSVDCISFGSEAGSLKHLNMIADILIEEPTEYVATLKKHLGEGHSFPKARELSLLSYFSDESKEDMSEIISSSNNILGIEYIKALKRLKSHIEPFTIERVSSRYNDSDLRDEISSATAIRNTFFSSGKLSSVESAVPPDSYSAMQEFLDSNSTFNKLENFSDILLYLIRTSDEATRGNVLDLDRDLSNRLYKSLRVSNSIREVLEHTKTKRYAMSRIKRVLIHMLLGLYRDDFRSFMDSETRYIRVLASNQKGFEILRKTRDNSDLCIINKMSDSKLIEDTVALKMLEFDTKASDLYYLGLSKHSSLLRFDTDYTTTPYIKK
ncbi:hypothetical protein EUAN_04470 [Andreesenia angusta]|uniref:tRNA(Met) cytidine acetate ligase n=1 Tax=Andreesenia angusta TaxID=39480 RepID=A0A1S1V7S8_9FIRM|nr:nucleotidyltransferase [Andreesenia angusta]OHW62663.1 hypothetical protein EUAN_04470 [Andreesenia angusta]